MNFETKDIAVVILNWNGKALLEQFLPSVVSFSKDANIYVADNASTDDSIGFLKTNYSEIKIIQNLENGGYAKGYNEALQQVNEPILCLLNSDIEVTENWLQPILNTYNSDISIGIIQPKILDFKQKTHFEYAGAAGGFIDKYGYPYCRGRIFNAIEEDNNQYNQNSEIFWASGACLFIKNENFKSLNGFDEHFFAHMEEIDLCWRAFNNGIMCFFVSDSTIYHVGGATLSNTNSKKTLLNFRNSLFTLVKNTNKNLLGRVIIRMSLDGAAALRFLFSGKSSHFFAILKAHFQFYKALPRLINQRKAILHSKDYWHTNSIVWSYFVQKKKTFDQL
ncbi:glycosyltransferase family 2 protein [Winogradskyella litorisediminis]|uniref:Glycosyltransferase family 2 protein n=1 Tax=Winogradskyella litorisediminis TaxID=1156618 RepID=A0ABW3N7T4_9FLAO